MQINTRLLVAAVLPLVHVAQACLYFTAQYDYGYTLSTLSLIDNGYQYCSAVDQEISCSPGYSVQVNLTGMSVHYERPGGVFDFPYTISHMPNAVTFYFTANEYQSDC